VAFGILGVGSYVPDRVLTNHDLEKMVETNDEWIRTRTGISERRVVAPGQASSHLGTEAARRALENARLEPADIDLIVACTFTPDRPLPSTACLIQAQLDISAGAAFDVNAACTGFVTGLAVAHGLLRNGVAKRALVIGAEAITRFVDFEDRGTCVLFGDGAGAVVLGEVEEGSGILGEFIAANGRMADAITIYGGGSMNPPTHEMVDRREQYMRMSGNEVFKFAVRILSEALINASERAGIEVDDLKWVIPHQANIRIIEGAMKRFHIPHDRYIINLDRYGNTSAASVPLAFDEAVRDGRIQRGDLIGLVAFGAGLTWGATIVRY